MITQQHIVTTPQQKYVVQLLHNIYTILTQHINHNIWLQYQTKNFYRQAVDMAFKQLEMSVMPSRDANAETFKKWNDNVHRANLILWEICCDAYTMWKIEHPKQGDGVRDFK